MEFLSVEDVLMNLEMKDSMLAAEFGCGSAAFATSLAKKLRRGRVYALDIQEAKLSALKSRLEVEKIGNVTTILCDLEKPKGSTLKDGIIDMVLIPNVLFQSENKGDIINEAKRVLRIGGQLLIIDWAKKTPFSPKSGVPSPEEIKSIAEGLGLSLKKEFMAGDYHYGLLFIK